MLGMNFGFGRNKNEKTPGSINNENLESFGPELTLSQEVKAKLKDLQSRLMDIYNDMEVNWKLAGTTLGIAGVLISNEAQAGGLNTQATQEKVKSAIVSLENINGLNAEKILAYEDLIAQYAMSNGEGFEVKGDGVSYARKISFGDNIGVRVYYKDSLTKKAEGFALNIRDVVDNRKRDKIIIDGNVALQGKSANSGAGNKLDGVIDKVVARVDGNVVATYYYEHKVNPETNKVEISTESDRLSSDGKNFTRMTIADGDKSFVAASEYMYFAAKEAAKAITVDGAVAQAETPNISF